MRPYSIQNFRNERGEVASSKQIGQSETGTRSVPLSGTEITVMPAPDTRYRCGELTALTVADPPAVGAWEIVFTSGAVPTATTIPTSILGMGDFAAEANTVYEINVLDCRGVYRGWKTGE